MVEPLEGYPLGFVPKKQPGSKRIPIWSGEILQIKKLILETEFKRMGPFKFIPIFFDLIGAVDGDNTDTLYYTPVFALVPQDYYIDISAPPNQIPMLLRANYYIQNNIRPVYLVNVPIINEREIVPGAEEHQVEQIDSKIDK